MVLLLMAGAMSLPDAKNHLFDLLRPTATAATTFTVNSTGDSADSNPADGVCNDGTGLCTLRAAIQEANAASGADTINFALAGTNVITLNTQLPSFSGNISLTGPGSTLLTIQRSSDAGTPIFQVFSFAGINGNFNNSVSGLTISNGNATGTFTSNMSGGGIFNFSGSMLTLTDVVITGSTSTNGGGLYNGNSASATLTNCKVTGNNSPNGGGILNGGTLTLTNTTVSSNAAPNGAGGGIVNSGGTLNINNSTISGNTSDAQGAGIVNKNVSSTPGILTITNSTLSGNNATGILASGEGAISNFPGGNTLTLNTSTVTANTAVGSETAVGGVFNGSGSTANIRNSIVANNMSTAFQDLNGTFTSQGFNLIGKASGTEGFTNGSNGDQVGTNAVPLDPKLGTLNDNGGPTKTHALLIGSPAIDAGNSALTTDQRGQPRPNDDPSVLNVPGGNASDIGAFETPTFQVNSIADTDDGLCRALGTGNGCTLREAIQAANVDAGADIIGFAPALTSGGPVTIVLLTALPSVSSDMTLIGPGANLLTVQRSTAGGTPDFRVFTINSGKKVNIALLSISNGSPVSVFNDQGTVVISNCVVKDAVNGGGIHNFSGSLVINNTTISGNSGAGISNTVPVNNPSVSPATLTINNSTISGNAGSGVSNSVTVGNSASPATVTINNSTISGNTTSASANGAGVRNSVGTGGTATVTINNSTISGNVNSAAGTGGIYNAAVFSASTTATIATVSVINSTIFGNTAGSGTGASGGISDFVNSCTGCTHAVRLQNTIVVRNFRDSGTTASDIADEVDPASSFNLIGIGGSGGLTNGVNNNQVGVSDPRLGLLANNGGSTQTHSLLRGSPALDAGNNAFITNPPFSGPPFSDQRGAGFARIVDGPDADSTATVDIGAFEAQVSLADLADQSINEDNSLSLPFNVGGGVNLTGVTATSSNTTLIPNNPANISISGSGAMRTLLITPVANEFGNATITLTVNGNNSQTMTDTFLLTVNSVNDAPSFTKGANQTVNENEGAQTVNNWATNIVAGPANEAGQTLTFSIINNSNAALFAVAPAIGPSGTLTYTPATGASGTATITVALVDNGGTANGGVDTSATQSFNINVREGGTLALSAATYNVAENGGSASIAITRSGGSAGTATVLFTTSNGTATAADYTSVSQTITFNDGEVSKTVNVSITDDLFKESDETVNLTLSSVGGSGQLGTQMTAILTIVDDDPAGGYIRFSAANYNTTESSGSTTITVERIGDTSQTVIVGYATAENGPTNQACATANGFASSRCDYTTALGTLHFAAGETSKSFSVLISQDGYVEGPETLTLSLSNLTSVAAFATPFTSVLTIADDATEPPTNPIDDADSFVRQHYHDLLNREPDAPGLAYWSNQITECQQPGATCSAEVRRINVSAAFFLSIEFQETGYLVERIYKSAYGDADALSALDTYPTQHPIKAPVVRLNEFLGDSQQISRDVQVGIGNWQAQLEANKVAFTQDFVARTRFVSAFPTTMTPADFVDKLFLNAVVTPSASERSSIINEFAGAGNTIDSAARARALRRVAENTVLAQQERNKAFVLMQYFGYLRRNPQDPQDTDHSGYDFWLHKLNEFNGNFESAQMVKAFLDSIEYRTRFAP